MQHYLDSLVADGAAGVLLLYRSGEQTWTGSAGRTELGGDQPVDPAGSFRIGSVTKTFTAVLVLQLVAEGKLRLDEPVGQWVPGVPDEITLQQLLNHTSGLYNYTDDLPDPAGLVRDRGVHWEPSAALETGITKPRLFAPGSSWSYSNTNYIALGLLIEAVTGNSYADELAQRIFQPLGLRRTLLPGDDLELPEPHAHGYLVVADEPVDVTEYNTTQAWAAGALVSTAADLNRFFAALLAGDVLQEPELDAMLTAVPTDKSNGYGLGIERRELADGRVLWGHNGGIFGYLTLSYHSADTQLTLSYTTGTSGEVETGRLLTGLLS